MPHASVPLTCCLACFAKVLLGSRPPPAPVSSDHPRIARRVCADEQHHPWIRVVCTRHQGRPGPPWCWAVLGLPAASTQATGRGGRFAAPLRLSPRMMIDDPPTAGQATGVVRGDASPPRHQHWASWEGVPMAKITQCRVDYVLRVPSLSTVPSRCVLALVMPRVFSDPGSRRRKHISHGLPSHRPLR
jgi:hypothetical protein